MRVACLLLTLAIGACAVMTEATRAATDPTVTVQPIDTSDLAPEPATLQGATTLAEVPVGAVIDQSFVEPDNFFDVIKQCCLLCQTFTAGITGAMVGVNVDVRSSMTYPLMVSVRRVYNVYPSELAASVTLPSSSSRLPSFVPLDPPVPVFAGAQYAICAEFPTAPPSIPYTQAVGVWYGRIGDPYDRGDAYTRTTGGQWTHGFADLRFQTYVVTNQPPDCSAARASIETLWPPDHRLVPITIEGVVDPEGDPFSVTITRVTSDEPVDEGGAFCPDAEIDGSTVRLRAERLGSGNGRVYTIEFVADDGHGGDCSGVVQVCVPHDRGHGGSCLDDGGAFDALAPCGPAAELPRARIHALPAPDGSALEYDLPQAAAVRLSVYDVTGRRVKVLEDGWRAAGTHRVEWEAGGLSRGIYFYRLESSGTSVSSRFVVF